MEAWFKRILFLKEQKLKQLKLEIRILILNNTDLWNSLFEKVTLVVICDGYAKNPKLKAMVHKKLLCLTKFSH